MTKLGRKRLARMNQAIERLVDARILGKNICFGSSQTKKMAWIRTMEDPMITPVRIADWRTSKSLKQRHITYEEADRLIRKHIGFGVPKHD